MLLSRDPMNFRNRHVVQVRESNYAVDVGGNHVKCIEPDSLVVYNLPCLVAHVRVQDNGRAHRRDGKGGPSSGAIDFVPTRMDAVLAVDATDDVDSHQMWTTCTRTCPPLMVRTVALYLWPSFIQLRNLVASGPASPPAGLPFLTTWTTIWPFIFTTLTSSTSPTDKVPTTDACGLVT